jgi:hypothetical protein
MARELLPIGVYYEHPDWFRPLFSEMERRCVPFVRIDARRHRYDPRLEEMERFADLVIRRADSFAVSHN